MTRKGLYKLITKPHIFLRDYIKKKRHKFEHLVPKKRCYSSNSYSVVSAVYNVEKYLDDYFKTLINQTLDFREHITLILVDDGSTDNSAKIIKKWQKKYPKNILYIKKQNGGQASARNVGLSYVESEWVTFIDPDDFVNSRYFEEIDRLILKDREIGLIQCRWRVYQESRGKFSFKHPLDFRFKNGAKIIEYKKDKRFLPSSVATTFYRTSIIKKYNLLFNENIKPNFEDGHFSARYFLYMPYSKVAYSANSWYNYRKRADGSSTLDNGWKNVDRFITVPNLGYLSLLKEAKERGEIPYALQRLIMYDLVWYFNKIVNRPQSIAFLKDKERRRFKYLVFEIFKYIDKDVIWNFELAGFWFFHKVGFLGMLKGEKPPFYMVYIDKYDKYKSLCRVRYFYYGKEPLAVYRVDNRDYIIPTFSKIRKHYFLDEIFCYEKIEWIDISKALKEISISIFNENTRVSILGKSYLGSVYIDIIKSLDKEKKKISSPLPINIKVIRKLAKLKHIKDIYKDAYVIMDRDTQADDNGEHFYRYLKENRPDLNIFFVLNKESHDFNRLKDEGFRLLPFNSLSHKLALLNAKYLISSHADKYVVDYMKTSYYGDMINYKFVFLQHGIIRDDISTWLNNKEIDLFITSMPSEYNSIVGDSRYKFTQKEVVLTGLARHDRLLNRSEATQSVILIMPTWRNSLVGDLKKMSAKRETIDEFYNSDYAKYWKSLLHSKRLKELIDRYGYRVVFFPHVNMSIYIDWFEAPSWIEVRTHKTDPILHKLFRRAKIMITDYSSVFFEMAILKKAILYYQFDFDYMYGGNHSSLLGYFDFERDGFGPVSYREDELLLNLENILKNNGEPFKKYLERMEKSLPFRDGKNRERILREIEKLDKVFNIEISENKYEKYLHLAEVYNHWGLIDYCRSHLFYKFKKIEDINKLIDIKIKLLKLAEAKELLNRVKDKSYFEEKIAEAEKILNIISEKEDIVKDFDITAFLELSNLEKLFKEEKWRVLEVAFELIDIDKIEEDNLSLIYYMWGKTLFYLEKYKESIEKFKLSNIETIEVLIFIAKSKTYLKEWQEAYKLWEDIYSKLPSNNREEALKYLIWVSKYLNLKEAEEYKRELLELKFLKNSNYDISILNII
jgi:CDP-glycerol glycerophosphotransferase (TagB/SpsB family)